LSAPQEIDEYELVDPVDILTPLEKSGFWDGVVSSFLPHLSLATNTFIFITLNLSRFFFRFPLLILLIFRKLPNGLNGRRLLVS
jgi:hypothetical protein